MEGYTKGNYLQNVALFVFVFALLSARVLGQGTKQSFVAVVVAKPINKAKNKAIFIFFIPVL